jgi:putative hemin transport protein
MTTSTLDQLRARHQQLVAAEPKLRIRDRAARLDASEAELVAADCGLESVELAGKPQAIFRELGTLGRVMALARNDWCVHERHGAYEDIQADGMVGVVLGPDIDLRMFFGHWKHAYSVLENGRSSIQFFDKEGVAVHKIYRTGETRGDAWDALVRRFASPAKVMPSPQPMSDVLEHDATDDPRGLREHWLALRDTHDFHPMLRKFQVSRLGALRAVGPDLAQEVGNDTCETMLQAAAASRLSIMCFVSNRGIVQIHSGPVAKLARTGPWFNVLDPTFNLHLNTEAITGTWIVNKPTSDGWVTSIEAYEAGGRMIVQFFGARKPGQPELPAWRQLMLGLCKTPLAA